MAPIPYPEAQSVPGVQRPTAGSSQPISETKYMSLKVILELLAGTVALFFFGALAWKTGRFIRSFTRKRVLARGNSPTTRYTRTWYGWIPRERLERNKNAIGKRLKGFFTWADWPSKTDLRRIWWDPSRTQMQQERNPAIKRWKVRFRRSRPFTSQDEKSNYRELVSKSANGVLSSMCQTKRYRRMTGAYRSSEAYTCETTTQGLRSIWNDKLARGSRFSADDIYLSHWRKKLEWRNRSSQTWRTSRYSSCFTQWDSPANRRFSLPCLLAAQVTSKKRHQSLNSPLETLRCSRKYQIWSARMQLRRCMSEMTGVAGPFAPPGSPGSEFPFSFSSHQSSLLDLLRLRLARSNRHTTFLCDTQIDAGVSHRNRQSLTGDWTTTTRTHAHLPIPSGAGEEPVGISAQNDKNNAPRTLCQAPVPFPPGLTQGREHRRRRSLKEKDVSSIIVPTKTLNDCEIRMIDSLTRQLEWNSNQLSPGQRPFHFAMLANHWLNRKTWIVYDPPCRVPIEARRQLGDPRFNIPYPMPEDSPKPKYPKTTHRAVHTPRLDSWRKAVNGRRRTLGLQEVVQNIELFESSADEPPDGQTDPACWILRKPPQGVGLSTKQEIAYYEGGAGWQETLSDWQKVRRGYRIRKAVYEGRVNRTRMKQVVRGVTRHVRRTREHDENGNSDATASGSRSNCLTDDLRSGNTASPYVNQHTVLP